MIITRAGNFMYNQTDGFFASNYIGKAIWFAQSNEYKLNYSSKTFSVLKSEAILVTS